MCGKAGQRAGDAHLLPRHADAHPAEPVQPVRAGIYSFALPAAFAVEGFDQHQEAVLPGGQVAGQFGDLLAQAGQFCALGEDLFQSHFASPLQL
jgi:hypothetical protein